MSRSSKQTEYKSYKPLTKVRHQISLYVSYENLGFEDVNTTVTRVLLGGSQGGSLQYRG